MKKCLKIIAAKAIAVGIIYGSLALYDYYKSPSYKEAGRGRPYRGL